MLFQNADDLIFGEPAALRLWSFRFGQSRIQTGLCGGGNVRVGNLLRLLSFIIRVVLHILILILEGRSMVFCLRPLGLIYIVTLFPVAPLRNLHSGLVAFPNANKLLANFRQEDFNRARRCGAYLPV